MSTTTTPTLVYDGHCPICSMAARYYRIRAAVGDIDTINMRDAEDSLPIIQEILMAQFDLNQGMVFAYAGKLYHGADALHMMALLGSSHGWFNKINSYLFRHAWLSRICYPIFKYARTIALYTKALLGKIPLTEIKY